MILATTRIGAAPTAAAPLEPPLAATGATLLGAAELAPIDDGLSPFEDELAPFDDGLTPFDDGLTPFDDGPTPFGDALGASLGGGELLSRARRNALPPTEPSLAAC